MAETYVRPEVSYDLDAQQVARYLIALDAERAEPDVTQLKLQKLMYLAQANYLAATGRRLFDEPVEAYDNGPVIHAVYKRYSSYSRQVIAPENTSWDALLLPPDARTFINAVWVRYRDWTANALWKLTHEPKSPWDDHYEKGAFRKVIPDEAIRDYYRIKVPASKRVLHPDVVVVDCELLDSLGADEDEIVAHAIAALR